MTFNRRQSRFVLLICVIALLFFEAAASRRALAFRITDAVTQTDSFEVAYEADSNHYYILLMGSDLDSVDLPADLGLGDGIGAMVHSAAPSTLGERGFYAVRRVPLSAPLDSDADLIDDVFELTYGFLNPLDAADAAQDFDSDGVDNRTEYLQGRDLTAGAVPDTSGAVALMIHTPLEP